MTTLLVDGCNTLVPFAAIQGRSQGGFLFNDKACEGFRRAVSDAVANMGAGPVLVLWDGAHSKRRQGIMPEYKADRKGFRGIEDAMESLSDIPHVYHAEREADDLIALVVQIQEQHGRDSCILSTDRDFYQLLSPLTWIRNRMKKRDITDAALLRKLGVDEIAQVLLIQACAGDTADGIPGLPGVGRKTALKWVAASGATTPEELAQHLRFVNGKVAARARESMAIVERNLELMDLRREQFSDSERAFMDAVLDDIMIE